MRHKHTERTQQQQELRQQQQNARILKRSRKKLTCVWRKQNAMKKDNIRERKREAKIVDHAIVCLASTKFKKQSSNFAVCLFNFCYFCRCSLSLSLFSKLNIIKQHHQLNKHVSSTYSFIWQSRRASASSSIYL